MNSSNVTPRVHPFFWIVKARLIASFGKDPNIDELKKLAEDINIKHQIPISRDTKRNKERIINWMCLHWYIVQNYLHVNTNNYTNDPYNTILTSKCTTEKKQKLMLDYLLGDKFFEIENILKKIFNLQKLRMRELKLISKEVCKQTKLKLNRNEKRDKISNLSWFSMNWNIIFPIISNKSFTVDFNESDEENLIMMQNRFFDESSYYGDDDFMLEI